MKFRSNEKSKIVSSLLYSCAIIGTCALMFGGTAQSVMAAELGKTNTVPTNYSSVEVKSKQSVATNEYAKVSYKVTDDTLEYHNDKKPTKKDITKDEAAKIGAQAIHELFNVDLDKATFYMGYSPETDSFPRDTWTGDVRFGNKRTPSDLAYWFSIDSVTGELFTVSSSRTLDVKTSLELDMNLAKNPKKYLDLATKAAEKLNLIDGDIKSVEYNSQGYSVNDPTITINVFGKNGKQASLSFSRYDKKLLAVGYDTGIKISEASHKKFMAETERQFAKEKAANKSSNKNSKSTLSSLN